MIYFRLDDIDTSRFEKSILGAFEISFILHRRHVLTDNIEMSIRYILPKATTKHLKNTIHH